MKPRSIIAAICLTAALAAGASAQDFDEPTTVDSIVVKGVLPGPAWWRVSDADSTVHILVVPETAHAGLAWDTTILDARMKRARLLIMPAEVTVGLTQIPGLFRTYKGEFVSARSVEETLPQPLRSQYVAMRNANSLTEKELGWRMPAYAAQRLEREVRKRQGMATGEVAGRVLDAAKRNGVRRTKPTVKFMPARVALTPMDITAGTKREQECLAQTLRTIDPIIAAQRQSASEWAQGDVRGLLALPRLSHRPSCDNDLLNRVERTHRAELLRGQIDAVDAALKAPGETIAVVRPGLLLSTDGVLMTLKARGYEIRTPANITEP